MKLRGALVLLAVVVIGLTLAPNVPGQAKPDEAVAKIFNQMMNAIRDNDHKAFIAHGTDMVKEQSTEEGFAGFQKVVDPRLKKGYESTYLCKLRQAGHEVHLWKLAFKDGEDDLVIRIAFKDGKVGGFFIQ